jgi:hypothetical protein
MMPSIAALSAEIGFAVKAISFATRSEHALRKVNIPETL